MPEVCRLFEEMTPKSRLAIIQRKQLCQFCFRHSDTQPCPSHSQPACPVRGCMHMHHRLLHNALLKEEARAIVVEVEPELDELDAEEEFPVTGLEDLEQLTSDESGGEEPERVTQSPVGSEAERPRLCQQRVPVEVVGVLHSLHTLPNWGSTVTLVRKESARMMGLWPLQTVQRSVRGFEGSAVITDSCHYLPLVDAYGSYQVICAYEMEEITTVARTRLPPWAREVFPSVRAHMPWIATEDGPVELLIGLDNTQ
jgi:hypothetical protein